MCMKVLQGAREAFYAVEWWIHCGIVLKGGMESADFETGISAIGFCMLTSRGLGRGDVVATMGDACSGKVWCNRAVNFLKFFRSGTWAPQCNKTANTAHVTCDKHISNSDQMSWQCFQIRRFNLFAYRQNYIFSFA